MPWKAPLGRPPAGCAPNLTLSSRLQTPGPPRSSPASPGRDRVCGESSRALEALTFPRLPLAYAEAAWMPRVRICAVRRIAGSGRSARRLRVRLRLSSTPSPRVPAGCCTRDTSRRQLGPGDHVMAPGRGQLPQTRPFARFQHGRQASAASPPWACLRLGATSGFARAA